FCIHLSHQRSGNKGWLGFFNRRFFRIYPAYLLTLCVFYFAWPRYALHGGDITLARDFGAHALAVHNLAQETYNSINASFWSIAVEIQLYAIYPLLFLLSVRLGWKRSLAFAGALEFAIRIASSIQS